MRMEIENMFWHAPQPERGLSKSAAASSFFFGFKPKKSAQNQVSNVPGTRFHYFAALNCVRVQVWWKGRQGPTKLEIYSKLGAPHSLDWTIGLCVVIKKTYWMCHDPDCNDGPPTYSGSSVPVIVPLLWLCTSTQTQTLTQRTTRMAITYANKYKNCSPRMNVTIHQGPGSWDGIRTKGINLSSRYTTYTIVVWITLTANALTTPMNGLVILLNQLLH